MNNGKCVSVEEEEVVLVDRVEIITSMAGDFVQGMAGSCEVIKKCLATEEEMRRVMETFGI